MFSNRFSTGIYYFIPGRKKSEETSLVFQQKGRHWRGLFLCLKCLRYVVYVHFERNENFPLGDQILLLSVLNPEISHHDIVDIYSV